MMRICALNAESTSDESLGGGEQKKTEATIEAQESEAVSVYNNALRLLSQGCPSDAKSTFLELLQLPYIDKVTGEDERDGDEMEVETCEGGKPVDTRDLLRYSALKNLAELTQCDGTQLTVALDYYIKAVDVDSTDVTVWCQIGKLAKALHKYSLARYAYECGLKCNPKHWPCFDNVISLLYSLGNYEACLQYIVSALRLEPAYERGLVFMDRIHSECPYLRSRQKDYIQDLDLPYIGADISADIVQMYVDEAVTLRNERLQRCRDPDPPALRLTQPLTTYTWRSVGECLLTLYDDIEFKKSTGVENVSFAYRVDLNDAVQQKSAAELINTLSEPQVREEAMLCDDDDVNGIQAQVSKPLSTVGSSSRCEETPALVFTEEKICNSTESISEEKVTSVESASEEKTGVESASEEKIVIVESSSENKITRVESASEEKLVSGESSLGENITRTESTSEEKIASVGSTVEEKIVSIETGLEEQLASVESSSGEKITGIESTSEEKVASVELTLQEELASVETSLEEKSAGVQSVLEDNISNAQVVEDENDMEVEILDDDGESKADNEMDVDSGAINTRKRCSMAGIMTIKESSVGNSGRRSSRSRHHHLHRDNHRQDKIEETAPVRYRDVFMKMLPSKLIWNDADKDDARHSIPATDSTTASTVTVSKQPSVEQPSCVTMEGEEESVRAFLETYRTNAGIVHLMTGFLVRLARLALQKWPEGLSEIYLKLYTRLQKHITLPDLLGNDEPEEYIKDIGLMTLAAVELQIDKQMLRKITKASTFSSETSGERTSQDVCSLNEVSCEKLNYLHRLSTQHRILEETADEFSIRVHWTYSRYQTLQNDVSSAIESLLEVLSILESGTDMERDFETQAYSVHLANMQTDGVISADAVKKQLEILQSYQSLDEIDLLIEENSYERIVELLAGTFSSSLVKAAGQESMSAISLSQRGLHVKHSERRYQLVLILDCLVELSDYKRGILYGEECLNEAVQNYISLDSASARRKWSDTIVKLLTLIDKCLDKGLNILSCVSEKNLCRFAKNLILVVEAVLDSSEDVTELPIDTSLPWILLYKIVKFVEISEGPDSMCLSTATQLAARRSRDDDESSDDNDSDDDDDNLPASLALLIAAHDNMGMRSWCMCEEGRLLLFIAETLMAELYQKPDNAAAAVAADQETTAAAVAEMHSAETTTVNTAVDGVSDATAAGIMSESSGTAGDIVTAATTAAAASTTDVQTATDENSEEASVTGHKTVAYRSELEAAIEQCFYCLYAYPNRRARSKRLEDHSVAQIELTWERFHLVFDFFKPQMLPEYDSFKTSTVSTEFEKLLRLMLNQMPSSDVISVRQNQLLSFIEESGDEPDFFSAGIEIDLSSVTKDIYYLLADYYFKNQEPDTAIKYYTLDLCFSPRRFDSWAGLSLAYASQLETKLSSLDIRGDVRLRHLSRSTLCCFDKALQVDSSNYKLWLEYGSNAYLIHSHASRQLKQAKTMRQNVELIDEAEELKVSMLRLSQSCFSKASSCSREWEGEGEELGESGEEWLQHYMLGKIAEKLEPQSPNVYLDHYLKASRYLHEDKAKYPKKIAYYNPPHLSVEALEMYYRLHVSIIKYLMGCGDKMATSCEMLESYINQAAEGPLAQCHERDSRRGGDRRHLHNNVQDSEDTSASNLSFPVTDWALSSAVDLRGTGKVSVSAPSTVSVSHASLPVSFATASSNSTTLSSRLSVNQQQQHVTTSTEEVKVSPVQGVGETSVYNVPYFVGSSSDLELSSGNTQLPGIDSSCGNDFVAVINVSISAVKSSEATVEGDSVTIVARDCVEVINLLDERAECKEELHKDSLIEISDSPGREVSTEVEGGCVSSSKQFEDTVVRLDASPEQTCLSDVIECSTKCVTAAVAADCSTKCVTAAVAPISSDVSVVRADQSATRSTDIDCEHTSAVGEQEQLIEPGLRTSSHDDHDCSETSILPQNESTELIDNNGIMKLELPEGEQLIGSADVNVNMNELEKTSVVCKSSAEGISRKVSAEEAACIRESLFLINSLNEDIVIGDNTLKSAGNVGLTEVEKISDHCMEEIDSCVDASANELVECHRNSTAADTAEMKIKTEHSLTNILESSIALKAEHSGEDVLEVLNTLTCERSRKLDLDSFKSLEDYEEQPAKRMKLEVIEEQMSMEVNVDEEFVALNDPLTRSVSPDEASSIDQEIILDVPRSGVRSAAESSVEESGSLCSIAGEQENIIDARNLTESISPELLTNATDISHHGVVSKNNILITDPMKPEDERVVDNSEIVSQRGDINSSDIKAGDATINEPMQMDLRTKQISPEVVCNVEMASCSENIEVKRQLGTQASETSNEKAVVEVEACKNQSNSNLNEVIISRELSIEKESEKCIVLLDRCVKALGLCLSRFPQHFKSLYRLAYLCLHSPHHRNVQYGRDLLLGTEHPLRANMPCPGLFQERKPSNFFQGLWRIPMQDIDRTGSFPAHIDRSLALLCELLVELGDSRNLFTIHQQLSRVPEAGKKYLLETDRIRLADTAFRLCATVIANELKRMKGLPLDNTTLTTSAVTPGCTDSISDVRRGKEFESDCVADTGAGSQVAVKSVRFREEVEQVTSQASGENVISQEINTPMILQESVIENETLDWSVTNSLVSGSNANGRVNEAVSTNVHATSTDGSSGYEHQEQCNTLHAVTPVKVTAREQASSNVAERTAIGAPVLSSNLHSVSSPGVAGAVSTVDRDGQNITGTPYVAGQCDKKINIIQDNIYAGVGSDKDRDVTDIERSTSFVEKSTVLKPYAITTGSVEGSTRSMSDVTVSVSSHISLDHGPVTPMSATVTSRSRNVTSLSSTVTLVSSSAIKKPTDAIVSRQDVTMPAAPPDWSFVLHVYHLRQNAHRLNTLKQQFDGLLVESYCLLNAIRDSSVTVVDVLRACTQRLCRGSALGYTPPTHGSGSLANLHLRSRVASQNTTRQSYSASHVSKFSRRSRHAYPSSTSHPRQQFINRGVMGDAGRRYGLPVMNSLLSDTKQNTGRILTRTGNKSPYSNTQLSSGHQSLAVSVRQPVSSGVTHNSVASGVTHNSVASGVTHNSVASGVTHNSVASHLVQRSPGYQGSGTYSMKHPSGRSSGFVQGQSGYPGGLDSSGRPARLKVKQVYEGRLWQNKTSSSIKVGQPSGSEISRPQAIEVINIDDDREEDEQHNFVPESDVSRGDRGSMGKDRQQIMLLDGHDDIGNNDADDEDKDSRDSSSSSNAESNSSSSEYKIDDEEADDDDDDDDDDVKRLINKSKRRLSSTSVNKTSSAGQEKNTVVELSSSFEDEAELRACLLNTRPQLKQPITGAKPAASLPVRLTDTSKSLKPTFSPAHRAENVPTARQKQVSADSTQQQYRAQQLEGKAGITTGAQSRNLLSNEQLLASLPTEARELLIKQNLNKQRQLQQTSPHKKTPEQQKQQPQQKQRVWLPGMSLQTLPAQVSTSKNMFTQAVSATKSNTAVCRPMIRGLRSGSATKTMESRRRIEHSPAAAAKSAALPANDDSIVILSSSSDSD